MFLVLSSLCVVIEVARVVWVAGVVCRGVGCMMWHAGDMKGTHSIVDTGDMAMWFLRSFVWPAIVPLLFNQLKLTLHSVIKFLASWRYAWSCWN